MGKAALILCFNFCHLQQVKPAMGIKKSSAILRQNISRSKGDFFLQSVTNLWQMHSYLLRDHDLLPKCSGTKAWSSKGHSYLGFKMLPVEKHSITPLSTCLSCMQNSTGFMKQIPLIMYFKFSITVEVNTEMQDLLIAQGSWVNSTRLTPQRGFPGGASGKEPPCHCRRHKRCGFNPWVR